VRRDMQRRLFLQPELRGIGLRYVRRVRGYMHVRLFVHTQLRWRRMRHIRRVRRNVRRRLLLLPELWSVRLRGVRRVRRHLRRRLLARQRQLQSSQAARLHGFGQSLGGRGILRVVRGCEGCGHWDSAVAI